MDDGGREGRRVTLGSAGYGSFCFEPRGRRAMSRRYLGRCRGPMDSARAGDDVLGFVILDNEA
ncbi:MAG: hypothetical protein DDT34_01553 [Firmicutes bacterium]|nr:hypothetical protein [Bacillota bacterium]